MISCTKLHVSVTWKYQFDPMVQKQQFIHYIFPFSWGFESELFCYFWIFFDHFSTHINWDQTVKVQLNIDFVNRSEKTYLCIVIICRLISRESPTNENWVAYDKIFRKTCGFENDDSKLWRSHTCFLVNWAKIWT